MKKLITFLFSIFSVFAFAQTNIFPSTGNVGIGTTTPSVPFQIGTTLNQGDEVFNFGNPQQYNQIIFKDRDFSNFRYGIQSGEIKIGTSSNQHKIMSIQYNAHNIELWPTVAVNSPSNILINAGANVGISNTNPQYKLDVNGTINATQLMINGSPLAPLTGSGNTFSLPTGTKFGIGNSPQEALDVTGNAKISGSLILSSLSSADAISPIFISSNGTLLKGPPSSGCAPMAPQWSWGGDNFFPYSYTGGSVSDAEVGTCNDYEFILKSNNVKRAWFKTDGTIGFGTSLASNTGGAEYKFHQGALRLSGFNTFGGPMIVFDGGVSSYGDWGIEYAPTQFTKSGLNFWKPFGSSNSSNYLFFLADDGMVGIGTDNPTYRLTVDAWNNDGVKILSDANKNAIDVFNKNTGKTEFRVKSNGETYARHMKVMVTNFPDYVFDSDYKVTNLYDIEKFYLANKRLPEMPSAAEVEKENLDLGEINKLLVKKIEEMTILMVGMKKEIDELKKRK